MVKQTINLDFATDAVQPRLYASQGDSGERVFSINCLIGRAQYEIPVDATVTISGRKPGNVQFEAPCTFEGNVVTCDCTHEMTDTRGYVKCEVVIDSGNGKSQSANFVLYVERRASGDDGKDYSKDIDRLEHEIHDLSNVVDGKQETLMAGDNITIDGNVISAHFDPPPSPPTVDSYTKSETDILLGAKQNTLVSGDNIKTINGDSILGEGDIIIPSGGESDVFLAEQGVTSGADLFAAFTGYPTQPMKGKKACHLYKTNSIGGTLRPILLCVMSGPETYLAIVLVSNANGVLNTDIYQIEGTTWTLTSSVTTATTSDLPSNTSDLTNDSDFQTSTQVNKAIENKLKSPVSATVISPDMTNEIPLLVVENGPIAFSKLYIMEYSGSSLSGRALSGLACYDIFHDQNGVLQTSLFKAYSYGNQVNCSVSIMNGILSISNNWHEGDTNAPVTYYFMSSEAYVRI